MSTTNTTFPNKYAGKCDRCGAWVPVGAGVAVKSAEGRWGTRHSGETCSATARPAAAKPAPKITPTAEQARCVELFATGGDLVIQAGAGTGKTSSLLMLAAAAEGRQGQYTAFNRSIVDDVGARLPDNVQANTMHSLAYRAIGNKFRHRLNGARMTADQVAAILGLHEPWTCSVLIGNRPETKSLHPAFLGGHVMEAVRHYMHSADPEVSLSHFSYVDGLDMPEDGKRGWANNRALAAYLLPFAQKAWADLSRVDGHLRYSHDCYLKSWQLSGPRINADFIMLDEAQDADPVQVAIVEYQKIFDTQVVVCGDDQQAIYSWRGAVNALADFEASGAEVGWLSQSFRFGQPVADVANGLLARLGARLRLTGNPEVTSVVEAVADPAAVLCRTNAGAVRVMLAALAQGKRPHLVGSATVIIAFGRAALTLQAGQRTSHPELACFGSWGEVQFYAENDPEGEDLRLMVDLIDDFGAQVIIDTLERQPSEDRADLVVSTAHKAKGRQWPSVRVHNDFMPPVEAEDLSPEELRLAYVAATRAQYRLDVSLVPHFLRPQRRSSSQGQDRMETTLTNDEEIEA